MARVFLLNPPSPEPVRTPLLAFGYLAAALERAGHAVALLDASASHALTDPEGIEQTIAAFAPDLVGLHIKTLHVQPAYALARRLSQRWPLCAGGPHPTVVPIEPLAHGFRYSLRGEGDETLCELADALDGRRRFDTIPGLLFLCSDGAMKINPPRNFILDLDSLASPLSALHHFDPTWYGAAQPIPYGGLLSSRGCPAACTFCSNDVTGRRFRYRSAQSVAEEVRALHEQYGAQAFVFFDDSFAVGRRRMEELGEALARVGRIGWSCTAHPAHLDPATLRHMKRAGCGGIDIGMESADPERLLCIGKGVTVERVYQVIDWCREAGLHIVVNLMFGWPEETPRELERAIAFLERAGQAGALFNARGVLVPYPGTPIYEQNHSRYGFTEWWLREAPLTYTPFPTEWSQSEVLRAYAEDAALHRNYFRHPREVRTLIAEALRQKAERTYEQLLGPKKMSVPAAGAR